MTADSDSSMHRPAPDRQAARHIVASFAAPAIGAILLITGLGLLAQYMGMAIPQNWTGIIFLVPAAGCLALAARRYEAADKRVDGSVVALMISALVFAGLCIAVLLRVSDQLTGALLLIGLGLALIARRLWPQT